MNTEEESLNLNDWYSPAQAAERLSANSGKKIDTSYVRTLARYNKIRSYQINARTKLYNKSDVDTYVVEERGKKSGRAQRQKAIGKDRKNVASPPAHSGTGG